MRATVYVYICYGVEVQTNLRYLWNRLDLGFRVLRGERRTCYYRAGRLADIMR